ncbi:MAG: hypothetical protein QME78_13365, partial [Thermodesulfobacteriota bacterium]|nr:hypothetical protein [Thermodesulfobacteriota bacterium]
TIIEKHPCPAPPSMVERQVQNLMARAEIRLAQQGMKLDETNLDRQKLRDSFLPVAEKNMRGHLILEKIAGMEKLSVSEAEQEENFEKLAAQLKQRVEAVKNYYQKNDLLEDLRAKMLEEKTLDFLLSQAKITEKENAPAATPAGDHPEGK